MVQEDVPQVVIPTDQPLVPASGEETLIPTEDPAVLLETPIPMDHQEEPVTLTTTVHQEPAVSAVETQIHMDQPQALALEEETATTLVLQDQQVV